MYQFTAADEQTALTGEELTTVLNALASTGYLVPWPVLWDWKCPATIAARLAPENAGQQRAILDTINAARWASLTPAEQAELTPDA
jgi:hypothetical protein